MSTQAQLRQQPRIHRRFQAILDYISAGWSSLTRSTASCESISDIKLTEAALLYLPAGYAVPPAVAKLPQQCNVEIAHLPVEISRLGQIKAGSVQPPGLLYLEHPYVVPGGRFNEMYGWDSYFIIRGLLRAGQIDLARGMVENFFFEIEHYGGVLNANRSYYLTRSQPPFLSSMVMATYRTEQDRGNADVSWLSRAYHYVERDYQMWTEEPHLAGSTGLSRYYDFGEGPVPEGLHDEINYYHDVLAYFLQHGPSSYVVESPTAAALPYPEYSVKLCGHKLAAASDAKCDSPSYASLSPEYYKGDRSMRESGFDISFRFGAFGADADHYAPVCLNSLLYKTETDLAKMAALLRKPQAALHWRRLAEQRKKIVQTLLWNQRDGMFFDYEFRDKKLSSYIYATTFYPLWVGLANPGEAKAVAGNLKQFEHEGGVAMSTQQTGVQWDLPYGWAPIQLIVVEGLKRYGYNRDADRIAAKFLSMVLANFERDHNLREKYDVVTDSSNIELAEGYRDNVIGFGWTNAVFLELLHSLPERWRAKVERSSHPELHEPPV